MSSSDSSFLRSYMLGSVVSAMLIFVPVSKCTFLNIIYSVLDTAVCPLPASCLTPCQFLLPAWCCVIRWLASYLSPCWSFIGSWWSPSVLAGLVMLSPNWFYGFLLLVCPILLWVHWAPLSFRTEHYINSCKKSTDAWLPAIWTETFFWLYNFIISW